MKFAIFTHVIHKEIKGKYLAYSPYVREMNLWFKYVEQVEVVAPHPQKGKPLLGEVYKRSITFTKIPSFDLLSFSALFTAFFKLPIIFFRILGAMGRADHLHVRCPGNIGLLACICQIFFPSKPKTAKYAGNWDPLAKQPWTYSFQKWILSNTFLTRNMKVLVYGNWQNQSKNILPFFTASFAENERDLIKKEIEAPYKFLFVGNLVPGKQPGLALQIVESLVEKNIKAELHIYGDGELMSSLEDQAKYKAYIHLHGNQPLEVLKQAYKDSHFLILPSKSEGWPKAVAEAMFFGCIPIATALSCVPWMLAAPPPDSYRDRKGGAKTYCAKRGIIVPPPESYRDQKGGVNKSAWIEEIADDVVALIKNPEEMTRISMAAQEWSQEYTLERFEKGINKILYDSHYVGINGKME